MKQQTEINREFNRAKNRNPHVYIKDCVKKEESAIGTKKAETIRYIKELWPPMPKIKREPMVTKMKPLDLERWRSLVGALVVVSAEGCK